mmetsp:Transcript_17908/g.39064  ORF Transcript_17908/g.39064 Transcript_17908/m.39064 type:complete len:358 (-) Transcript_17908:1833-2906(-)
MVMVYVRKHIPRRYLQLLELVLVVFLSNNHVVQAGGSTNHNQTVGTKGITDNNNENVYYDIQRSTIYTYFERIDVANRTTGMSNDDDDILLRFWKERWEAAGYLPVVLTTKDASLQRVVSNTEHEEYEDEDEQYLTKSRYDAIQFKLDALRLDDFSRVIFRKWIAMAAVGGGWFSDYDNFPLPCLYRKYGEDIIQEELPNEGRMTVHDIISPTLASGSAKEWIDTLEALLDDAKDHCHQTKSSISYDRYHYFDCFYTDSLAIHSLRSNHHKLTPQTSRFVTAPFDKNDPVSFDDPELCSAKGFAGKWTVHFGPEILQRGRHVPPTDRLPKHRFKLAKDWLDRYEILCSTATNTSARH